MALCSTEYGVVVVWRCGDVWRHLRVVSFPKSYGEDHQQNSNKTPGNVAEWLTRLTRNGFNSLSDQFPSGAHVRIMPLSCYLPFGV